MIKKTKIVETIVGCPTCAGRLFVPHRHITNKRNKKQCPTCKGEGEITKLVEAEY